MNPVSVSYRYNGTWYRFGMGGFGDIGIGLNILLTDTDISVLVYRYRSNSSFYIVRTITPTLSYYRLTLSIVTIWLASFVDARLRSLPLC